MSIKDISESNINYLIIVNEINTYLNMICDTSIPISISNRIDITFLQLIISCFEYTKQLKLFNIQEPTFYLKQLNEIDSILNIKYYYYLGYVEFKYYTEPDFIDYEKILSKLITKEPKRLEAYFSIWQKLIINKKQNLAKDFSQNLYSIKDLIQTSINKHINYDVFISLIINIHLHSCLVNDELTELIAISQKEFTLNKKLPCLLYQFAKSLLKKYNEEELYIVCISSFEILINLLDQDLKILSYYYLGLAYYKKGNNFDYSFYYFSLYENNKALLSKTSNNKLNIIQKFKLKYEKESQIKLNFESNLKKWVLMNSESEEKNDKVSKIIKKNIFSDNFSQYIQGMIELKSNNTFKALNIFFDIVILNPDYYLVYDVLIYILGLVDFHCCIKFIYYSLSVFTNNDSKSIEFSSICTYLLLELIKNNFIIEGIELSNLLLSYSNYSYLSNKLIDYSIENNSKMNIFKEINKILNRNDFLSNIINNHSLPSTSEIKQNKADELNDLVYSNKIGKFNINLKNHYIEKIRKRVAEVEVVEIQNYTNCKFNIILSNSLYLHCRYKNTSIKYNFI